MTLLRSLRDAAAARARGARRPTGAEEGEGRMSRPDAGEVPSSPARSICDGNRSPIGSTPQARERLLGCCTGSSQSKNRSGFEFPCWCGRPTPPSAPMRLRLWVSRGQDVPSMAGGICYRRQASGRQPRRSATRLSRMSLGLQGPLLGVAPTPGCRYPWSQIGHATGALE